MKILISIIVCLVVKMVKQNKQNKLLRIQNYGYKMAMISEGLLPKEFGDEK